MRKIERDDNGETGTCLFEKLFIHPEEGFALSSALKKEKWGEKKQEDMAREGGKKRWRANEEETTKRGEKRDDATRKNRRRKNQDKGTMRKEGREGERRKKKRQRRGKETYFICWTREGGSETLIGEPSCMKAITFTSAVRTHQEETNQTSRFLPATERPPTKRFSSLSLSSSISQ